MTVVDIQEQLFERFGTLNEFSGVQYLKNGNVSYPNKAFKAPADKRYFVVSFLVNDGEPASNFDEAQDRYNGLLQVDICTPLDKGEDEANEKYRWLCKLFARGSMFGDVIVTKTPSKTIMYESDHYKAVVRIEWEADIDKE